MRKIHLYLAEFNALGISSSRTFGFWHEYLEMMFTLLNFIEAESESNWLVHLETFEAMLPYDKSFNHYKYLSWGLIYLTDMLRLPEAYPQVLSTLWMGSTQSQDQKQNHGLILYQQILHLEQSLNRDCKTKGKGAHK